MLADLQDSIKEADRDTLLRYLNRAYKEIYDTYDLPGSVTDEFFSIDGADGQIVLPEYVDQIRGAGAECARVPLSIADFRSGYRVTPQFQQPYEWRVRRTVPLSSQMDATDQIRVVLLDAETETVNVYITGQTSTSSKHTETLTFTPGETEIITTAQWVADNPYALTSITKDKPTKHDIKFYVNSTGTEIATLRNRYLSTQYVLIQVTDQSPSPVFTAPFNGAKIVYKLQLSALYYDTDEIIYPKVEDAIVWKARELWFGSQETQEAQSAAQFAYSKCQALINTIVINQESESEKKVTYGRNQYEGAWRYGTRRAGNTYGNFFR